MVANSKKNLLFIIATSTIGGGPNHLYTLLKNLDSRYSKVIICPNDGPFFEKFNTLDNTIVYNLNIRKLSVFSLLEIIWIVLREKIDLIHSHGKGAGFYGRLVGLLTNKKVVHTFHGIHYHETQAFLFKKIYVLYERLFSKLTDCFINVSESEREFAIRLGILDPKSDSKVIYNAVSSDFGHFKNINHAVDYVWPVSFDIDKSFIVGTVANFYYAKGYKYLIEAALLVKNRIPNIKFLFVGDGPLINEKKLLAKKLGVYNDIYFMGTQHNIPYLLERMDIFVLPSRWEGMPISLLEAMAKGKPVIGTRVTGISEIIENNYNGKLVESESAADLAEAIYHLFINKEQCLTMGNNAKITISTHFSINNMVRKTENIYQSLLH